MLHKDAVREQCGGEAQVGVAVGVAECLGQLLQSLVREHVFSADVHCTCAQL